MHEIDVGYVQLRLHDYELVFRKVLESPKKDVCKFAAKLEKLLSSFE